MIPNVKLPEDQAAFSAYNEVDLPTESRIESMRRSGIATKNDVWVAIEKVHGTNFAAYLINEREMRFAKRSGIMDPNENFFGYHVLVEELTAQMGYICELIKKKFNVPHVNRLIMHGEMFGARYDHPQVPKSQKQYRLPNGRTYPIAGIQIQMEPFPQYSPELHFFAFDLKYTVGDEENLVGYDDACEIFAQVPNLIYGKPIVRGTFDECLAFDVENFVTPLPGLLGLGNYPLEGNWAEGVCIRHVLRGTPAFEAKCARLATTSMIKVRSSAFMELKHPGKQKELKEAFLRAVREKAVKLAGNTVALPESVLPEVEAAANALLLNHVSDGRLNNVVSKIGVETLQDGSTTLDELSMMLTKDALKDFLKDVDPAVLNTAVQFRKMLGANCYREAVKVVRGRWNDLAKPEVA